MMSVKTALGRTLQAGMILVVIVPIVAPILLLAAAAIADSGFVLTTSAFEAGQAIPVEYSCAGANRSPALQWSGAPAGVGSFALIVEDPDAPSGNFIHWVVFNLPADAAGIAGDAPRTPGLSDGALQGANGMGRIGYMGPCPPPGKVHHYHFELFALDSKLDVKPGLDAAGLRAAMQGHIKANTELVGIFER
jgi:Raf kinase inhibitor-like YbhB/YbcL family protein